MADATKQAEHTPGPWDLRETIFGDAVYEVTAGSAPPGTVGWAFRKKDEGEGEANARLIAAAPELLEAAEAVAESLEVDPEQSRAYKWEIETLRNAIAKAKGDTNG